MTPVFFCNNSTFPFSNLFDVFVIELVLEIDCVRRDDRFFVLLEREENRGHKVSERFADAGAGLDDKMSIFLEGAGNGGGHGLLLRAKLEILRFGKHPVGGKNRADPLDKFSA